VAENRPGVRDVVVVKESLVTPNEPRIFAAMVDKLLSSQELREEWGARGRDAIIDTVRDQASCHPIKQIESGNSMVKLALLRHGHTAWNHAGRIQGNTDIPITEVSEQKNFLQILRLALNR